MLSWLLEGNLSRNQHIAFHALALSVKLASEYMDLEIWKKERSI